MDWFENGWGLSLIVFLPVIGAAVGLAMPKAKEAALKWVALGFALVTLALTVVLAARFDYSAAGTYQFGTAPDTPWIEAINAHFHIAVDGISLPMVVLKWTSCEIYSDPLLSNQYQQLRWGFLWFQVAHYFNTILINGAFSVAAKAQ